MRILQATNFFKPSFEAGGVARVAYDLSKSLVKNNHEITVFTTNRSKKNINVKANRPLNIEGIKVYYFDNLRKYFPVKIVPIPYYLPIVARKEIQNFDIIHIHEHRSLMAIIVYYYAKKYNIPYVLQAHGSVLPFLQKQNLKKIFDIFFGYNILKDASKVIALNETEASQYQKMGVNPYKIEVIPNGIDLSDYNNVPKKGTFRAKNSISINDKIILYVGRLHRNKGIDLLVNSYSILIKNIPDSKLVFMGPDDGFRIELELLCENLGVRENVLFTGFVDFDTKVAALIDSDIFVTPTFSGFPVSFLEACVFGLPIITTTKGDNLDWIDNKVGYVVPYNDEELSDAMFNILSDETLRKKYSDEANKLIETIFSMDVFINNVYAVYQKCVKQSKYM
ncbi:glycosyltransferase [Methanosarcina mazei]|uniref:Glycosyltransferase n=1 Tax=Methanosarcina mazei TaxID=2209 RepID=A0A0F8EIU6_METMZ|nr:glycosyltransferase [Methanosarcina mazei]KKG07955.1 hypothetical protein DU34_16875 [Methanosarcina mazei]